MIMKVAVRRVDGSVEQEELLFNSCAAIGYAARDQEKLRKNLAEAAKKGVSLPYETPAVYWIAPGQTRCVDRIQVIGKETSAEIEIFMAKNRCGERFFTVASDHCDRSLEKVSVSKSKQICPKIIGPEFWALNDVCDHWDDLRLICHAFNPDRVLYQESTLAALLPWQELESLAEKEAPMPGPTSFCSGTVPMLLGPAVYAKAWRISLEDPIFSRSIDYAYTVVPLPDRS